MSMKKLIIVTLIAIVTLNLLNKEAKKNFDKAVVEAIKNNSADVRSVLVTAPGKPEQPSEEEQLKNALANKVDVDIGSTPVRGDKNAPIKIVVFSDFQCPFSKRGAQTIASLMEKYGEKVMFVHKNLPLPFHPEAEPAARAAIAAGKQGKFYEYHDKLYESQAELGEEKYVQIAKDLGLNIEKFNTDRNGQEIKDQVKAEADQASNLGFRGTPGFALNGVKILGAYPQEHFEKIISALGLG